MHVFFWCEMTHYFKTDDIIGHFHQNECSELVHGPFNIQIYVDIELKSLTDENTQVFFSPARF